MRRLFKRRGITVAVFCLMFIIGASMLYSWTSGEVGQNQKTEIFHPRNIVPILLKNYNQMRKDIESLNQTLREMSAKVSESKFPTKSSSVIQNAIQTRQKSNHNKHTEWDAMIETKPSYNVHAFYYPWYGNPEHEGEYFHWNHQYIQHWKKDEAKKWPSGRHKPPDDVGANFYPALGAYSSSDRDVIDVHMKMMKFARIGVVVVSWYPPGDADAEGNQPDSLMPDILESAQKFGLKVALHVEPYKNRNHVTLRDNLVYVMKKYGNHSAFYKTDFYGKTNLPLFYIYDSYTVASHLWAEVFTKEGKLSVRNTELDGIFIGLLVEQKQEVELKRSGFDGLYTYFATNGFTYGSSWVNWKAIAKFCVTNRMMFIPSIGPGYIDTEVRPWNGANKRKRLEGKYYNESFTNAFKVSPNIISITSFNEWHEGTQIEPAIKKDVTGRTYLNYGPRGENFYLNLTRKFVDKFEP